MRGTRRESAEQVGRDLRGRAPRVRVPAAAAAAALFVCLRGHHSMGTQRIQTKQKKKHQGQHLPVRRLVLVVDKVGLACATSQDVSSRMIMLCIGYCALCIKRNARADARAWQGARERVLTHPSRGKVLHTRSRIERALGEYDMPLL